MSLNTPMALFTLVATDTFTGPVFQLRLSGIWQRAYFGPHSA